MSIPLSCFTQIRSYILRRAPRTWTNGVKYEQVTYYPRHKDHKDPPIKPTKLLMVQRVEKFKGNPYWDKNILIQLKLDKVASDIAIVKNTPEMCTLLWKIKHLIKVTPINMPDKLPNDESVQTWLHENGDLLMAPRVDPDREKATIEFINNPKRLDRKTLKEELRYRWLNPYDL
ncbi:39S ribosomal protein L30, mitochondrial [Cotesia glomerata]|uniref:Large ribosomal subunit protein uL30m n=1 Tax=Cotesia glomerata TaxID=32391 RepID=A0AAV7J283_COTGL|nr:39S ribosomal protein L30, mitochondrial [Cotesia glomerata]XP_044595463.1 39S ribosomal protein L30, mitochondrial [Cotesia glomerata]KAH0563841.1 hypothetical protein KQX54_007299 [Cotesia glomerata]